MSLLMKEDPVYFDRKTAIDFYSKTRLIQSQQLATAADFRLIEPGNNWRWRNLAAFFNGNDYRGPGVGSVKILVIFPGLNAAVLGSRP